MFHDSATGARDYRGRLIDFVTAALKAARLPVPVSEEKVWALVPKNLRSSQSGLTPTTPRYKTLADLVAEHRKVRQNRTRP